MSADAGESESEAGHDVLVLGSANVDIFTTLDRFPRPGETVFGRAGGTGLGGKGANQAVAAALTGARTTLFGMVGDDAEGETVRSTLAQNGVDPSGLRTLPGASTGRAYITVNQAGENTIIVVSGANAGLTPAALGRGRLAALLDATGPALALTQGELPADTVDAFARACRDRGVRFVLNLAPVIPVCAATLRAADPLVVNEHEAAALLAAGRDAFPGLESGQQAGLQAALAAARTLARDRSATAVVTLGAQGAVASDGETAWHQAAPPVAHVVDSTGAGDAFVGALAACLACGGSLADAVRLGVQAGSLAVAGQGTVPSYQALRGLRAQLGRETVQP